MKSWKVLSNLWMGSSRKSTGQSRVREVKLYFDVINAMFECNLSCNDVQENEICLNDSCKVMIGMKTNTNTHSGHHGLSVIVKRKSSYDHRSKICRINYAT